MADLVITSVNPTKAPESVVWCSDPKNVIKELTTVGLPGDYFYSPMQLVGEWDSYQETICSVDPSGRGSDETTAAFISQRNGFLYLHEMRAYREYLKVVKNIMYLLYLSNLTLVMVSLLNSSKSTYKTPNKLYTSQKLGLTSEKKTEL
jgi:hypothetical protein